MRHLGYVPLRRLSDVLLRRRWVFDTYPRRHWDVQRDVVTTSPRRLVAGWKAVFLLCFGIRPVL